MNDIKVYVNFRIFIAVMTVWLMLLLVQLIMSIVHPEYILPAPLMNIFMLVTGSVLTIFQGIEKNTTFTGTTESKSLEKVSITTDDAKGKDDEKAADPPAATA
jgi:hypothetical protein